MAAMSYASAASSSVSVFEHDQQLIFHKKPYADETKAKRFLTESSKVDVFGILEVSNPTYSGLPLAVFPPWGRNDALVSNQCNLCSIERVLHGMNEKK